MTSDNSTNEQWLVVEDVPGLTIAPSGTPLTRLRYYDGKFLRARDLELEQDAQRQLVHLSNQAGGFGIVHGLDIRLLAGDLIEVGPGRAIDAAGRLLLLPMEVAVSITELIARSQPLPSAGPADASSGTNEAGERFRDCTITASTAPPGLVVGSGTLWLVTIAHAEFLCGEEDVYGRLCEQACVGSSERPFRVEGVSLRARPLPLTTPLVTSRAVALSAQHLRSQVASAYFSDERGRPASLVSGAGLRSSAWCHGAELADGEVALGVLCRQGTSNLWLDAWTVRRERMDAPPRDYWAHRMAMRPWREYIAQILQLQCQLAELATASTRGNGRLLDPGPGEKATLVEAHGMIGALLDKWSGVPQPDDVGGETLKTLTELAAKLHQLGSANGSQVLIDGGIIELPPAGYLPVDPNSEMTVSEQVRRLLGDGVDLRFCVSRADDAARELEGAQHMDRISLLAGLDDPRNLPQIDILVPDGRLEASPPVLVRSKPADTLTITAVHDWVLFHARHHRECAPTVVQPPPSRRYQLYAFLANGGLSHADAIVEGLLERSDVPSEPVHIGEIEYVGGGTALKTMQSALEAMWTPHGQGHVLTWAGIASVGAAAAEGETMAYGRLLALTAVVEQISPWIDGHDPTVLDEVPSMLDFGNADGVIVLVPAEQQQVTLSLFRASRAATQDIRDMLEGGSDSIPTLLGQADALHLGNFEFPIDRDTPTWSDIKTKVPIREVPHAFLLTQTNDTLPHPEMLEKQAYAATLAVREYSPDVPSMPPTSHHQLDSDWGDYGQVIVIIWTVPDDIEP